MKAEREVVYGPESALAHPAAFVRDVVASIKRSRSLVWRLWVRDISAQHRQSVLGILWIFVPPIVLAVGFSMAKTADILNLKHTEIPYPAYVVLSVVLWQTFTNALNVPMAGFQDSKAIFSRIKLPPEAPIIAKMGDLLVNSLIRVALVVVTFLFFRLNFHWEMLVAPLVILPLVFLGFALGLVLIPLASLYNDVGRALGIFVNIWMFLTPVVYPVPGNGYLGKLVHLNPVTPLLVGAREFCISGSQLALDSGYWGVSIASVILFFIGWIFYRCSLPYITERLG